MCISGITILLSLSVFSLIVADIVPATSMAVPLVGKYKACTNPCTQGSDDVAAAAVPFPAF